MKPAPVNSFVHALVGFVTFIGVSLGITVAVNSYAVAQSQEQHAAALQALIQPVQ